MSQRLDDFYLSKEEPNKSCLLALRDIILSQSENASNELKYGMPCFLYKKKMFCFLWTDKITNEPYILFVEGKHLNHSKLEQGNRSRMKVFRVNPNKDIPVNAVKKLLNEALDLYRNNIIKIK